MAIDDEDSERQQALSEICGVTRHGIVDGVEFDFRHKLLDPREWRMDTIGIESPPYFIRTFDPLIWFPWYGEFSKATLRREAKLYYESDKNSRVDPTIEMPKHRLFYRRNLRPISVQEYVRNGTPECTIYAGDKIVIKDVDRHVFGDELDHTHDYELRYALLNVIRSNGKTEHIQTPVRFQGITSILNSGLGDNFFDKIYSRICQHFNIAAIDLSALGQTDIGGFASAAAFRAYLIAAQIGEFRKLADNGQPGDPPVRDALRVCHIADEAVHLGYLWAKAEAEIGLKPLARSALRVKAGAISGGAKSGAARRQKRAASWEPIAKEMAKKLRARKPSASQDDIATDIAHEWIPEDPRAPGHVTLKGLISRMEKAGELPKRQRI